MADQRHNYEYEVDMTSRTAPANVVRMVGREKRVLEVGCGPGSITRLLSGQGQCRVTGLELDPEAIKKVSSFCEVVMQADLNAATWPNLLDGAGQFDVVVAADVLEHLYDPWTALQRMVPFIRPDGYLVVSLPHVGHAAVAACLVNGDFEYRDWGLLDRTHIRFFGLRNIEDLFARAGLKIIEASYVVKPPEESEFAATWSHLSAAVRAALSSSPHAHVYQVVVKAVPLSYPGNAVPLVPPTPGRTKAFAATWKRRIGACLSPQIKQHIRKGFSFLGIKL